MLGERCGGRFTYTKGGVKDCSACTIPHVKDNYYIIIERLKLAVDETRKK
jgi:Zn-finger protein